MSLLKKDIIRKRRVNKIELEPKFKASKDKEYKVEAIRDNVIYANKAARDQLLELYYLVSWKSYSKIEDTWEPASTVIHLRKMMKAFTKTILKS